MTAPIRVLVVDDSAVVRQAFRTGLNGRPGIEVVGVARDPYDARDQIAKHAPDVITLDIEMPRMNGLSFLKRLMKYHPIPTIVVSSVAPRGCTLAIECLEAGAFDIVSKPGQQLKIAEVIDKLAELIVSAAGSGAKAKPTPVRTPAPVAPPAPLTGSIPPNSRKIIAIGASTGGTEALTTVLSHLPADAPGILVTQHMPAGFTTSFAQRLDTLCQLNVREAKNGDRIERGTVLLADGAYHLKLARDARGYVARVLDGPKVCRHKPSVEVLFESVAQVAKSDALGVMLTGMGKDGAGGMLSMRRAGAVTIAQDEATSVVFGMPKEAIDIGAACHVAPLQDMADHIVAWACGNLSATEAA